MSRSQPLPAPAPLPGLASDSNCFTNEGQDRPGDGCASHSGEIDSYDTTALLPKITAPTLVIAGREAPLFPVEDHAFIAREVERGRLAVVEQSDHVAQTEQPSSVTALIWYRLDYGAPDM
jgi:pimeloyl-ACP methyl ester carboxylesterase